MRPPRFGRRTPPTGSARRRRRAETGPAYLFLLPGLILLAVFFLWPAVLAVQLAFTEYRVVSPPEFNGLDNFTRMFGDERFLIALRNSAFLLVGLIPFATVIPLAIATALNRRLPGVNTVRFIVYLPVVVSMVAVAMAWQFVFDIDGPINWLLMTTGVIDQPLRFLLDPNWALPAIIVVEGWKGVGTYVLIYLGALQAISPSIIEASTIDGANAVQRYWRIIVPLVRPYIAVCLTIAAMNAMQVFASVFVLTQGGPYDQTLTLGYYVWSTAFQRYDMGYASAVGLFTWILLIGLSAASFAAGREKTGARP
jgi:putative chitobiose transport system permease protein